MQNHLYTGNCCETIPFDKSLALGGCHADQQPCDKGRSEILPKPMVIKTEFVKYVTQQIVRL